MVYPYRSRGLFNAGQCATCGKNLGADKNFRLFFFFFAVYEFTAKQLCAAINATLNYVIALANLDVASRGRKGRFLSAVAYFRFYLYRNLTARNHSAVGDSG